MHIQLYFWKFVRFVVFLFYLAHVIDMLETIGETGSSCYNFHVFKHIMQTKRATLVLFSIRQDEYLFISKSMNFFLIRVNILKILRNKQSQKIVTTYPKVGVSCYSTWGKLLQHLG